MKARRIVQRTETDLRHQVREQLKPHFNVLEQLDPQMALFWKLHGVEDRKKTTTSIHRVGRIVHSEEYKILGKLCKLNQYEGDNIKARARRIKLTSGNVQYLRFTTPEDVRDTIPVAKVNSIQNL